MAKYSQIIFETILSFWLLICGWCYYFALVWKIDTNSLTCECSCILEKLEFPWNFSLYWICIFVIQDFWATCACPEKQLPWKFSLYWIYFLHFWVTCTCPEKQKLPWNFSLYLNIFYHSGFLSNSRFPWKPEFPQNFSLYWICIFYHSGFLSNLRLPWKTELPWNFSLHWNIFLSFRIFQQLMLALKTEFDLKFFKPGGVDRPPDPLPRTPMVVWFIMSTSSIFEASLLFCAVCWASNVTYHLISPKLNARQNRVNVLQNDFFIFKIRTRQIRYRLHCAAQQTGTNMRTRSKDSTSFTFKTNLGLQRWWETCVSDVVILWT